jgi:hypothetical protein
LAPSDTIFCRGLGKRTMITLTNQGNVGDLALDSLSMMNQAYYKNESLLVSRAMPCLRAKKLDVLDTFPKRRAKHGLQWRQDKSWHQDYRLPPVEISKACEYAHVFVEISLKRRERRRVAELTWVVS